MALQRALQRALTITYASSSLYPRAPRDIPELVALCGLYQVGCVLYTECCTKSVVPSLLCQVCRTKCVVPSVLYKCVVPRVLYQECCTKSVVAPSMSCQVYCTKSVGPSVLCQECCTKSVGPSTLREVCCTKSVVPIVLYQVCYASTQELEVMLQNRVRCVCRLKCQDPLNKIENFCEMQIFCLCFFLSLSGVKPPNNHFEPMRLSQSDAQLRESH